VAEVCIDILPKLFLRASFEAAPGLSSGGGVAGGSLADDGKSASSPWVQGARRAFQDTQNFMEALSSALIIERAAQGQPNNEPGRVIVDAQASGTTATVVLVMPGGRLLTAHVGDSRAVLGVRPRGDTASRWRVMDLTRDHKPDLVDERARIERCGAQVLNVGTTTVTSRVFTAQQAWPAINMSRSLGDLHAHTQGLTHEPEVTLFDSLWNPEAEEAVLILGSDGVWDVLPPAKAVELAGQMSPVDPAVAVASLAFQQWSKRSAQQNYSDDITVIAKFL